MLRIVQPPQKFLLADNGRYPDHQRTPMIEHRALEYFTQHADQINSDLIYMPIQWTAYHKAHHYGQYIADLQYYIEGIVEQNPHLRFFTIVQYADGILAKFPNCKIFAAGGRWKTGHPPPRWEDVHIEHDIIPIPLLCDSHPISPLQDPKFKVSFAGSLTHPVRLKMMEELSGLEGYHISEGLGSLEKFRQLTNDSTFVLCPRGYGLTSFRLYELIQMQRIPIYVSDDMFLPFTEEIDWERLAICISPDKMGNIPQAVDECISSGEYLDKIAYGKEVHDRYFTWLGCLKTIERIVASDYPQPVVNEK